MKYRTTVLACFLMAAMPAAAWHDTGHRATAYIAWEAMTSAERSRVAGILRGHPRFAEDFAAHVPDEVAAAGAEATDRWLFGQAATWPDLIQQLDDDVMRGYHRGRWHYINLPIWLSDGDRAALEARLEHNMATDYAAPLSRSMNSVQALRGNLAVWRDAEAPAADRAIALCWILHLTGDMHQPLHNVALFSAGRFPTGDRGGNDVEVAWGNGTRNLHSVWDGLPTGMPDLTPSARTLRSIDEDVVTDDSIDEWLSHHAALARRFVYTDDLRAQLIAAPAGDGAPAVTLSHEYLVSAKSIALRQVNLAGHRIRELLR